MILTVVLVLFVKLSFGDDLTQTVRGTVTDKLTRQSLVGATVQLIGVEGRGTVTDSEGRFRLDGVPVGRIGIRISYIGYQELVLVGLSLTTGKELVLNVELDETVYTGEEVVVKAARNKGQALNRMASVSARTFSVEETERYAGSRNDVARMASNYAGVVNANDARNDIVIRGNSPSGLLWRMEGVDIPNPNHYAAFGTTGGPVSMLNNTMLANSDFMTGAFPSEYGNALAGVFDLHMRSGNNEKYEFLGQIGFNGFEFGAEGPISRASGSSFLLNFRYSTLEVFEKLGMNFGASGIPYYKDASFKLDFPKTAIGKITVFGLGGTSTIELWDSRRDTTKEEIDLYGGEGFDLTNGSDMGTVGVTHSFALSENTRLQTTLSGIYHRSYTKIDSLVPPDLHKTLYFQNNYRQWRYAASFTLTHKFDTKNSIKAGVNFTRLQFDMVDSAFVDEDNRFETNTDFNGATWLTQAYVQWQHKTSDRFSTNSGLHFSHFALNNTWSVEPRVGVKWKFASTQSLSFGAGLHAQTNPITVYLRQVVGGNGDYLRSNKNLKMQKSVHLVSSYDWGINEQTRFKAEAYYQYIFDAPVSAEEANDYSILNEGANFYVASPDYLKNSGTGRNVGVEITLERFLHKGFYLLNTVSLFDSRYKGSDGKQHSTAFNGNYVVNILTGKEFVLNPNKPSNRKSVSLDIKWTLSGGQRYTPYSVTLNPQNNLYYQEFDENRAFEKKFKDYNRTDFKIVYRKISKKFMQEWGVEITNLFNQANPYGDRLNRKTGKISQTSQLPIMVIPQYRIVF